MKAKPNIDQFNLKKDPSDFLEGGSADLANRTEKQNNTINQSHAQTEKQRIDPKIHREQKVFRLSLDLINALKRESYEQSVKSGSRVTETELVEQALRAFLKT